MTPGRCLSGPWLDALNERRLGGWGQQGYSGYWLEPAGPGLRPRPKVSRKTDRNNLRAAISLATRNKLGLGQSSVNA